MLSACVCGASPGAPPAHAGAPPAARRGRRAAARPTTRAWPAGGASGQAGRGRGRGCRFGWGGARPRQAPARALRSPGGALPWCCGCVRARARVLALSTFSTGEYDSCDGFRIGYAVTGGRHFHLRPWQVYCILECSRSLAARAHFGINLGRRYWEATGRIRSMDSVHAHALRSMATLTSSSTVTSARHLVFRNASSLSEP